MTAAPHRIAQRPALRRLGSAVLGAAWICLLPAGGPRPAAAQDPSTEIPEGPIPLFEEQFGDKPSSEKATGSDEAAPSEVEGPMGKVQVTGTATELGVESRTPMGPMDARPEQPDPAATVLDPADRRDPRSVELMHYGCQSELSRRDVTLFANGTIRLRDGLWIEQRMQLHELGPKEIRGFVDRLIRIRASRDLPTQLQIDGGMRGKWIGQCRYHLDVPGYEAVTLKAREFDVPPLALQQVAQLAEELAEWTRPLRRPEELPSGYEPEAGDVLYDVEGQGFVFIRRTLDGAGLELDSLDGSQRIYLAEEELRTYFVRVEEAADWPGAHRAPGR